MSEEEIIEECKELAINKYHELGDCWDEEKAKKAIERNIKAISSRKRNE